ncbi:MAG: GGDEF domain-containing protein [Solirubrobacteraceae bacterium]|nr:GGDEF domain-containing protein [Patulibacter sp.]
MQSLRSSEILRFLAGGRQASDVTAEDLAQMRITGAIEYIAGAITLVTVIALPDPDRSDNGPYLALAGVGVLLSLLRYWAPQRLATPRVSIIAGFVYIAAIVSVSQPVGPTPFFFIWPMLTAAYYLGRRDLVVGSLLFSVALAVGLTIRPGEDLQLFVSTWSVIVIVSGLVLKLRERVDRLVGDLAYTASTDMLTGLANRRTFEEALDRELERSRRTGTPVALAIFDLDHFKQINDRLGHAEGDRALKRFASLLAVESRAVDVPARIGGEEFALIFSGATAEGGRVFGERLIARLAELTQHDPAPLSVSIGITEMTAPTDTQDLLLLAADRALYEAKHAGRGRAFVARPAPSARVEHTGQRLEVSHAPMLPTAPVAPALHGSSERPAPEQAA